MEATSFYDHTVTTIDGQAKSMRDFKGKVLLIVNTASKCGYTPQYEGLNKLHEAYHLQGFEVLGFPCNQFGNQEPGSEAEIKEFCDLNFKVSFPMFAKIDVNGDDASSLFKHLKKASKGFLGTEFIKWNFTKFLIDKEGHVIERYGSVVKPQELVSAIEEQLQR